MRSKHTGHNSSDETLVLEGCVDEQIATWEAIGDKLFGMNDTLLTAYMKHVAGSNDDNIYKFRD